MKLLRLIEVCCLSSCTGVLVFLCIYLKYMFLRLSEIITKIAVGKIVILITVGEVGAVMIICVSNLRNCRD